MKRLLPLLIALFTLHMQYAYAQVTDSSAQWTWMTGTNTNILFGTFGTKGVPSATNHPGRRYDGASWKDRRGNLYVFGGTGYNVASTSGDLNDMWKYTTSTGMWTWMSGSNTGVNIAGGTYGTLGVAAATNTPGSRVAPIFWTDTAGKFWMFGGGGMATTPRYNDLWMYDPLVEMWTWMGGPNTANAPGVYGTQGVPSTSNIPGPRGYGNGIGWCDSKNNFWLFGGSNPSGAFNDLWKYNPVTKEWTWMTGSSGYGQLGVYGTKGVAAATNVPGARSGCIGWIDANDNLYLYGGALSTGSRTNDLWKYDPTTNMWTWLGGTDVPATLTNVVANYGTQNAPSAASWPGGRSGSWKGKDAQGNFWMMGGYGYASTTTPQFNNDLWKYNPTTGEWTYVMGSKTAGVVGIYGTKGVQARTNYPGSRAQMGMWIDDTGNFWVYAGQGWYATGSNLTTDLWKLSPPPCYVSISANKPLTICQGDSVTLKAVSTSTNLTYQWFDGATQVGTDTSYVAKTAGSYTVKIANSGCTTTSPIPSVVAVNPLPTVTISPATAVICNGKDTALTGSGGATTYTWAPATFTGSGATVRANPLATTTYTVTGTDANGCKNTATRVVTVNTLPNVTISPATAVICNGKDTALTGGGATTYTWAPATYTGSGATVRPNPTTTTTYTVTGTDNNGCQNTATRAVTVNTLPNVTISPATAVVCNGKDTALTAGGATTYTWAPATYTGSGATIRANTTGTTTYTVTGTDANGCKNTATRVVTVNANPNVVINPSTAAICIGKDTGFAASGAVSYSWTPSLGLNVVTGAAVRANPTSQTDYIVTGTDANGCIGKDTQRVVVKQLPVATITPAGPVAFCEFDSILLTAGVVTGANNTFVWKSGTVSVGVGDKYMVKAGGNYTVTVRDTASCSATSAITVVAMNTHPSANLTLSGPLNFCRGGSVTMSIPFDTGLSYTWYDAGASIPYATTSFYQAINSGTYKVIVSRNYVANCTDTSVDVPVVVYPLPEPVIYGNGADMYTDSTYVSYHWYYMGINILTATSYKHKATKDGSYMVIVVDANGCTNTSPSYTVMHTGVTEIDALAEMTKIYPNPVSNRLFISSPEKVIVQIVNLAGQQVVYQVAANEIDVSSLTNGVYIARIIREDGSLIKIEKLTKF